MSLHTLTYAFELDGGNIQYKTTQAVEKAAATHDGEVDIVTTGLTLGSKDVHGIAVVDLGADAAPDGIFDAVDACRPLAESPGFEHIDRRQIVGDRPPDPAPAQDIHRFERTTDIAEDLAALSTSPGAGLVLYSNLTRCRPFERDLWLVPIHITAVDGTEVTPADVVTFYSGHLELLEDQPSLKLGVFNPPGNSALHLSLIASLTDQQEAQEVAAEANGPEPLNFYRFELSKASLVVGESTHGPGQTTAVFRSDSGEEFTSRELAYCHLHDALNVSYHPLGVLIDGELYRPVTVKSDRGQSVVGEPLPIATYRGSPTSRPWQFGVTRADGELLMTQARASPAKFDPVLKRFPIEGRALGAEPLIFSHTVSRRVWSEDPLNLHVQSQRSEGLRTQFLYEDSDGWHLIQPDAVDDPRESAESSFEPTKLDGVSVRSALLRANTEAGTKATVEHEYRITDQVFEACDSLFALSYYEANEESMDTLEWEIADATAYEIT